MLDPRDFVVGEFSGIDPVGPRSWQAVESGWSGAVVWRLDCRARRWAVRRWPEGYRTERLAWVQSILLALPESLPIPKPLLSHDGQAWLEHDGFLWSIEPWMRGEANYWSAPSEAKLTAAMRVLAQFHRATSRWSAGPQTVPAITERLEELERHAESLAEYRFRAANAPGEVGLLLQELLVAAQARVPDCRLALQAVASMEALLRPCIRDVWHDHVLFSGQQVTGLIDFGAMRVDSIATDIARLVGSLVGDDRRGRRLAIAAYQTINALTRDEERMIGVLDLSTQVIAGLNWVRWLSVENRTFPNPSAMAERIRKILGRLKLTRAANI